MHAGTARWLKAMGCFGGIAAYSVVYQWHLRLPILHMVRDLPVVVQKVIVILSLLPIFLLGTCGAVILKRPAAIPIPETVC